MQKTKESLHPLPVVPNGVDAMRIVGLEPALQAAQEFGKQHDITDWHMQKVNNAALWIAYRCSPVSLNYMASAIGRNEGAVSRAVHRIDQSLRHGGMNAVVDGILQILVRNGDGTRGAAAAARTAILNRRSVEPKPAPQIERPRAQPTGEKWQEAGRLRKLGWSYTKIAKRVDLPEEDVAHFCGVSIERRI